MARQFKVKWWSNFAPSNAQQLLAIRHWISGKNAHSNPSPIPIDAPLLSRTIFPSDKEFIKHLKFLKKKASKTLSQLSRSSFDDDDVASSSFLGDVNEDMCRGLPYTPLG